MRGELLVRSAAGRHATMAPSGFGSSPLSCIKQARVPSRLALLLTVRPGPTTFSSARPTSERGSRHGSSGICSRVPEVNPELVRVSDPLRRRLLGTRRVTLRSFLAPSR